MQNFYNACGFLDKWHLLPLRCGFLPKPERPKTPSSELKYMAITDINLKLPFLAEQKHNHDYNCATKPPTNQIGWKFNSLYPIKMFHIHLTFILTTNYKVSYTYNEF